MRFYGKLLVEETSDQFPRLVPKFLRADLELRTERRQRVAVRGAPVQQLPEPSAGAVELVGLVRSEVDENDRVFDATPDDACRGLDLRFRPEPLVVMRRGREQSYLKRGLARTGRSLLKSMHALQPSGLNTIRS